MSHSVTVTNLSSETLFPGFTISQGNVCDIVTLKYVETCSGISLNYTCTTDTSTYNLGIDGLTQNLTNLDIYFDTSISSLSTIKISAGEANSCNFSTNLVINIFNQSNTNIASATVTSGNYNGTITL